MEEKCEIELTEGYHSINSRDVRLHIHKDADTGSSKPQSTSVKVQTVTKFTWPKNFYPGSLISVSSKFIAYVIRGKSDAVRVLNRHTATRVLLKGFNAPVCDISFAHTNSAFFGAIDEVGTILIFSLDQKKDQKSIHSQILLKIERDNPKKSPWHRLVWSPKIGRTEESDTDIEGLYLASTMEDEVEVWKLSNIIQTDRERKFTSSGLEEGGLGNDYVKFPAHDEAVTDVSLAPDGNVMCTSSADGRVKFWDTSKLVNDEEGPFEPQTLHTWYPHDQKPVSSIKFLDNHNDSSSEIPFWRFLLTGAEMNTELKIWCTVKWVCLQTISFNAVPKPFPEMKINTDQSGNYILITDIHRRVVYCLECYTSFEDEGSCYIRSVNVCFIESPVLSFIISTVKAVTMMSAEEPPKRRRGVQIQCFTLHQSNLYKLQTRVLHHDSFLSEVAHSGSGTPAGFLSPTRVLSPSQLSGDEQIYNAKSRIGSDNEGSESRAQSRREKGSKTPRSTRSKTPRKMSQESLKDEGAVVNGNNEQPNVQQQPPPPAASNPATSNEPKDMSSIIEKLKSNRRSSNSSSVSTTSVTGAIEMTSGAVDDLKSRDDEIKIEGSNDVEPVPIPVGFQDEDSSSKASSAPESRDADEAEAQNDDQPKIDQTDPTQNVSGQQPKPNLLESIFGSVKKTGSISLAENNTNTNDSLTEVTQMSNINSPLEEPLSNTQNTDSVFTEEPPSSMDAMSLLIDSIKKQTEEKMIETQSSLLPPTPPNEPVTLNSLNTPTSLSIPDQLASIIGQRPEAPGTDARVLIFGDESISKLDQVFMENTFSTEIHMLEGAETKNMKAYIQESVGIRKDAELCIFHIGSNDISSKRSESQYNTDLMILFGACRTSFPNARLCCSSVLPRHDEFGSKVSKFNLEADKICEVTAVEFLNNTKLLADIDNYVYKSDPTECVKLTEQGRQNLGMHFLCFIEDSLQPGKFKVSPKMIIGPKLEKKLPKEGYEVRNLTPVTEDKDEIPDEPRHIGDGSKSKPERDGTGDGSQSPLPPTLNKNTVQSTTAAIKSSPTQPNAYNISNSSSSGNIIGGSSSASSSDVRELCSLVRKQNDEIEKLRQEVRLLKNKNTNHNNPDMRSLEKLTQELKSIKTQLSRQGGQHSVQNGIGDHKLSAQIVEGILPQVTTRLCDAVERTTMSKLNSQIQDQLSHSMNSSSMANTIGKSIEGAMAGVHRVSMEAEVIPRFEKSTREMFRQIAETFNSGTEDYIRRLEDSLERNLTNQISKSLQTPLQTEMKKFHLVQQNSQLQVNQLFGQMRQLLVNDVEKLLVKHGTEMNIKVEDAIARAQTPAPMLNPDEENLRQQIKRMVERGLFNEAFTKALMASDVPVVVDLMNMVDQNKIFPDNGTGCALEQNIILSLIQQLSVDLKQDSAIKYQYLQDAVLSLDVRHQSAEHIPNVLNQLQTRIGEFISMWPRDAQVKNYRLIQMTAGQIISQISGMKHEFTNHSFN